MDKQEIRNIATDYWSRNEPAEYKQMAKDDPELFLFKDEMVIPRTERDLESDMDTIADILIENEPDEYDSEGMTDEEIDRMDAEIKQELRIFVNEISTEIDNLDIGLDHYGRNE